MAVGDPYVFPGFLTPVLKQLFFPKPPTTLLTCFCKSERRKSAGKKRRVNRGSNSQPRGHESDTLTTEPPGRGDKGREPLHDQNPTRKKTHAIKKRKWKSPFPGQSVCKCQYILNKICLTISSIFSHFNILRKKALGKQFHLFPPCFLSNLYLKIL